jgi:hypothetical protein
MKAVKPPGLDTALDRARGEAGVAELEKRDNPVLVPGDAGDRLIGGVGAFRTHLVDKAPTP